MQINISDFSQLDAILISKGIEIMIYLSNITLTQIMVHIDIIQIQVKSCGIAYIE